MSRRIWTKEEIELLEKKYPVLPCDDIAKLLDRSLQSVYIKASKLGIKSSYNNPVLDEEKIIKMYVKDELDLQDIAKVFGATSATISKIIPESKKRNKLKIDVQEAIELYESGVGSTTIAKKYEVTPSSILKMLKKNDISIREGSHYFDEYKIPLPDSELTDLYSYGFSSVELAELYGTTFNTVISRLKERGISIRESNSFYITGESNSNWKGGITPVNTSIRGSREYHQWRTLVFERDNFTCQCCEDSTGGNLHSHHIYNFAEHIDLRFEVSNGATMCDKCHSFQIIGSFHHTYGARNNDIYQLQEYFDDIRSHLGLPLITIESIINQSIAS